MMLNIKLFLLLTFIHSVLLAPAFKSRNPTLLISIDGLRQISLDQYLNANLNSNMHKEFVDVGVKADYMTPSFPASRFPNHFTLVTGYHAESHHVVGNKLYDPTYSKFLQFVPEKYDRDPKYWNQTEPIWITASKQGLKTASSFWIGSEVFDRETDLFINYDSSYKIEERCDEVVNWYKKFNIDFGTLYIGDVYDAGTTFGPDSVEYLNKIDQVDKAIGYLFGKLKQANVLNNLNIIVVSDSGMTGWKKTLVIKDYVDETLINYTPTVYETVTSIYPKTDAVKAQLYNALKTIPNVSVYYKEDIPKGLHFKNSNRIGPIVVIADEGYSLERTYKSYVGLNGYDNSLRTMRAIFLARGPDFLPNTKIRSFLYSVDVYPLLCELLHIDCDFRDGTIFPFMNVLTNPPE